jgi:sec-independent protein translocase protein TatB
MLDIGFTELALIAVVSLVVIGPKDLPKVLKTAGFWMRKARMMTREFQNSVDDMIRDAELDDMRRKAEALRTVRVDQAVEQAIDPTGALKEAFEPPTFPSPAFSPPPVAATPPPLPISEQPAVSVSMPEPVPEPEPAAAAPVVPEPEPTPEPPPKPAPVPRTWFVIGADRPNQTVYRPRRPDPSPDSPEET